MPTTARVDLTAQINFNNLSAGTNYGVHLIFKTTPNSIGLDTLLEASVSVGGDHQRKDICLKPTEVTARNGSIGFPVAKSDEWMELELGQFYCDNISGDKEAVVSIKESKEHNEKSGLIIAGIEIRPMNTGLMLFVSDLEIENKECWKWVDHRNKSLIQDAGGPSGTNSNKKSERLIPSSLKIEHSGNREVWQPEEDESETRFGEVVRALGVTWLEIDASINFFRLSPNTDYAAYLIYKTTADSVGLDAPLDATISVGGQIPMTKKVCIKPSRVGVPRNKRRKDNWMEMELGQFRVDDDTGKADISLKETTVWKTGLTIAGIEVRPV